MAFGEGSKERGKAFLMFGKVVIYTACALADLLGAIYSGVIRLRHGKKWWRQQGAIVFELDPESKFAQNKFKNWGGHTAAPHVMWYNHDRAKDDGKISPIEAHEGIHGLQFEAYCLRGFILGGILFGIFAAIGFWKVGLGVFIVEWIAAHWIQTGCNTLQAWLRGGDYYRDSAHEIGAYSYDQVYSHGELNMRRAGVNKPKWWE